MTKIEWGVTGQKYYETGVDRGVLFVDNVGVPWNGLISVDEKTSGGDSEPLYQDGLAFDDSTPASDFSGSITAYSSPKEFDVCDGTTEVYPGLMLTQQKRSRFNFSYRTLVGNDVSPTPSYLLHLIFNATAKPTDKSHASINDTSAPLVLTWDFSTLPVAIPGHRASAHIKMDSRYTNANSLAAIEEILYGNQVFAPRFPAISEILALFATPPSAHNSRIPRRIPFKIGV